MSLEGRSALITGASRNLGPAIASSLAAAGARVAVNHRHSPDDAADVVGSLPGGVDAHLAVPADVAVAGDVAAMVESVVARFGTIDILVNNAGPYGATPLSTADEAEWGRVVDANLKGVWLCTRAVAPHMERAGWGRVVNLSAVSSSVRNRGAYGLAKAALEVLTEELAWEMAPYATVNALAPGQIEDSLEDLAAVAPDWAAEVMDRTPRGRLVTRAELAEVVVAICGDAFASMTATTLRLDGGLGLRTF
jgi:3-oxoacyl-[acyl-carrier protein] reductase